MSILKMGNKSFLGKHLSPSHKLNISLANRGKKSHRWKGGITKLAQLIRNNRKSVDWRTQVFKRDDYTCQNCGATNGNGKRVYLEADHIKAFSLILAENQIKDLETALSCLELWDIKNGRTLCKDCHYAKHKLPDTELIPQIAIAAKNADSFADGSDSEGAI